jgi:transcription elongation factor Elf1
MTQTDPHFSCPRCGAAVFKVALQPKSIHDLFGAVCFNCGSAVTEEDIQAQILAEEEAAYREFRKARMV